MKYYCSFLYAKNNGKERRLLWKDLQAAKNIANDEPWIFLGDFNVTLKLSEHTIGGSNITNDM